MPDFAALILLRRLIRGGFPRSARLWRGFFSTLLAGLAIVVLASCAGPKVIVQTDDRPGHAPVIFDPKPVSVQTGKASYYWQDTRTASGERFNPEGLTAAHRKLPFGTWVRAVNLRNGKSVIVRINDRGPYIRGRIIDLSRGAARQIDMIKAGVVPIRVEVLREIKVVQKPNIRLTSEIKQRAQERLRERQKEEKPAQKPASTEESGERRGTRTSRVRGR